MFNILKCDNEFKTSLLSNQVFDKGIMKIDRRRDISYQFRVYFNNYNNGVASLCGLIYRGKTNA
jgi:hypothetical protein